MLLIFTWSVPAVHQVGIVAVVVSQVKKEVILALRQSTGGVREVVQGGAEGNLLTECTASNTNKVAGAVTGVGQVGRRGVSGGTGDPLLTLTRHQTEAVTCHISSHHHPSPDNSLPLECQHGAEKNPHSQSLVTSLTDVILKLNVRDKD